MAAAETREEKARTPASCAEAAAAAAALKVRSFAQVSAMRCSQATCTAGEAGGKATALQKCIKRAGAAADAEGKDEGKDEE